MKVRHVGLICRSEENADRFYEQFLGLKKLERKMLPAALSEALFHVHSELVMLNYLGDSLHFEIFIRDKDGETTSPIAHVCLEVGDLDAFLKRCAMMNVSVLCVAKGADWITFIRDYDGNLFEIKETQV